MRFWVQEFKIDKVMAVGDACDLMAKIGSYPRPVSALLKRYLRDLSPDASLVFGKAVFEDGREFWTMTKDGMSRKKPVKRTDVFDRNGVKEFSNRGDAKRALFAMEAKREDRVVRSVMAS